MAGIYIHIPFCKQACNYCNFHFSTNSFQKEKMVSSLLVEIEMQKKYLANNEINTIYFGGGTPSLLSTKEIETIIQSIYKNYSCQIEEITLEANPDDLTLEKVTNLKSGGINRLSIGVQSFFDKHLLWMNRVHDASHSKKCIEYAQQAGISNLSIDLIYGVPGMTNTEWKENLKIASGFNIPHLSCYALTIEPKTTLANLINKNIMIAPSEKNAADHYEILMTEIKKYSYEQYEISNFAIEKNYSKHNTNYWTGEWYLGIGPSAHSYNGTSRQWNISNNSLYMSQIGLNQIPSEIEILSIMQKANEYIMTSLRTKWGLDLELFKKYFGNDLSDTLLIEANKEIKKKTISLLNNKIYILESHKFLTDGIISNLFFAT